ncbi:hypothetical protein RIF29_30973 [Crotalaria pallida]|uniref:Uncharacterized protein n=1 Tax=Crotalaria pallida TaxID=3830 RepID=A0AAN9I1K4_CROPI
MKLTSKSIFSPSHHSKELPPPHQMTLSSSSSSFNKSRLVSNNGQASPMFPSVGRKRGPGFETNNPEPSSPKVTCIGQVRVKAKKRGARSKSRRRSSAAGEASFRRTTSEVAAAVNNPNLIITRQKSQRRSHTFHHQFQNQNQNLQQQADSLGNRNQRWVHIPLTICEALKGFGAELSCLFPCKSSCTREKEDKGEEQEQEQEGTRSRWMVTMQEGKREIELVMGEEEQQHQQQELEDRTHRRRHVFEDIDLDNIENMKNEEKEGGEEEKGRVSICIPPKNALLLMRCRSDPVKVAALANKFLEPKQEEDHVVVEEVEEEVPMEEDEEEVQASEKDIAKEETAEEAKKQETNEEKEEEAKVEEKKKEEEDEDASGNDKVGIFSENDVVGSSEFSSTSAAPSEAKGSTEEEEEQEKGSKERESKSNLERGSGNLPECLLLMMCSEPKLSIEVSKETWVCTADFVRWLPPRTAAKTGGGDRQAKKRVAVESKPPLAAPPQTVIQPGRSSCSLPAPEVGSNRCEPSVLARCKSEPRGSAAAKLAPEGCFWNNRKMMERHHSARLGIGAAGIGF